MQDERCAKSGKSMISSKMYGNVRSLSRGSLTNISVTSDDAADSHSGESTANTPSSTGRAVTFKVLELSTGEDILSASTGVATPTQAVQLDTFLGAMTACAIKLVEWARHIPAFAHLNFGDQVRLLKASWCDLYILHLAVHNGANPDTLVLGGGVTCKREQIGDPEVSHLIDRISSEVSSWFESLSTEPVEINCLKGILLFNPGRLLLTLLPLSC